jgi:hypothetical protein
MTRRQKNIKVTADEYDENQSYDYYYYYYIVHLIDYDLDRYLILLINYLILLEMDTTIIVNTKTNKHTFITYFVFLLTRIKIEIQIFSLFIIDLHDESFARLFNVPRIIPIITSN